MSVIVKNMLDNRFDVYVKGSPEKIRELCRDGSVPANYEEILGLYTEYGYRVLALGWKRLPSDLNYIGQQRLQREQAESEIEFLGFLVMQNKLKPVTEQVIATLNHANIRTIMATGDNVLTAISVARECKIIEP